MTYCIVYQLHLFGKFLSVPCCSRRMFFIILHLKCLRTCVWGMKCWNRNIKRFEEKHWSPKKQFKNFSFTTSLLASSASNSLLAYSHTSAIISASNIRPMFTDEFVQFGFFANYFVSVTHVLTMRHSQPHWFSSDWVTDCLIYLYWQNI